MIGIAAFDKPNTVLDPSRHFAGDSVHFGVLQRANMRGSAWSGRRVRVSDWITTSP